MSNRLTEENIEFQIKKTDFFHLGQKTTVCLITLENGFEVVGTSGCVNPSDYDREIGERIAKENAKNKIWELEGYMLQETIGGTRIKN